MHKVYLKPGKEDSLKRFHPWIFSGAIARFDGEPDEGEVVEVYTSKKEFIAEGHFQIGSIAVRVLSFRQEPIDHDFWKRKLEIAYDMRRSIGIATNPTNNTYRLVHGEGDNLPGLVIDVYAKTAVMQAHSAGMHVDRMTIAEALSEVMGDKIENIYYKSETTLPFKADLFPENGFLKGGSSDNIAQEYGIRTISWPVKRNDEDGRFYLNGKPVFINGVCEYEHQFGQSHAFSREQVAARVKQMRAAGFNAFRDAHQPHHLDYQKYWDEEGVLFWTQLSAHVWYDTPEFREDFKKLLRQWVKERRNSPSVVIWGLQNESMLLLSLHW